MQLSHLRAFVMVADLGKVSAAADALHLAPPAVSRQIKALEEDLGQDLFHRRNRRLFLTPFGRHACDEAKALLEHAEHLRQLPGTEHLRLTIGASISALPSFMPAVVAELRAHHPDLELAVQVGLSRDVEQMVLDGTVDAGLVAILSGHPALHARPLFPDPLLFVSARGPAIRRTVSVKDVARAPIIAFPPGVQLRDSTDRQLAAHGVRPKIVMTVDSFEVIKRMVESGLGAAILPHSVCKEELGSGMLTGRTMMAGGKPLTGTRHVCAITLPGRPTLPLWEDACEKVAASFQPV